MKKLSKLKVLKKDVDVESIIESKFNLMSGKELSFIVGGYDPCDAVCLPSEWGGPCNCLNNLC